MSFINGREALRLHVALSMKTGAAGPTNRTLLTNLEVTVEGRFERDHFISSLLCSVIFHSTLSA